MSLHFPLSPSMRGQHPLLQGKAWSSTVVELEALCPLSVDNPLSFGGPVPFKQSYLIFIANMGEPMEPMDATTG